MRQSACIGRKRSRHGGDSRLRAAVPLPAIRVCARFVSLAPRTERAARGAFAARGAQARARCSAWDGGRSGRARGSRGVARERTTEVLALRVAAVGRSRFFRVTVHSCRCEWTLRVGCCLLPILCPWAGVSGAVFWGLIEVRCETASDLGGSHLGSLSSIDDAVRREVLFDRGERAVVRVEHVLGKRRWAQSCNDHPPGTMHVVYVDRSQVSRSCRAKGPWGQQPLP